MKAYAVKDPKGKINTNTIMRTGKLSRRAFCFIRYWKGFYNAGYRCVPVEITEIKIGK